MSTNNGFKKVACHLDSLATLLLLAILTLLLPDYPK